MKKTARILFLKDKSVEKGLKNTSGKNWTSTYDGVFMVSEEIIKQSQLIIKNSIQFMST